MLGMRGDIAGRVPEELLGLRGQHQQISRASLVQQPAQHGIIHEQRGVE